MNRIEFIIATAIILFVTFLVGWFGIGFCTAFHVLQSQMITQLERMAGELNDAEEARDSAVTYMQQREADLTNQMTQIEAELKAAMDDLQPHGWKMKNHNLNFKSTRIVTTCSKSFHRFLCLKPNSRLLELFLFSKKARDFK